MTVYTNTFFGIPEDDTRFNLPAAVEAYEWVLNNEDVAPFVISKMLYDYVPQDIRKHRADVEYVTGTYIAKRLRTVKTGISRSIISKHERGEDTAAVGLAVEAIDIIAKAYESDGDYNEFERRANAAKQRRDKTGRFVLMNRRINPVRIDQEMPLTWEVTNRIPDSQITTDPERRRRYQNDYTELKDILSETAGSGRDHRGLKVTATYTNGERKMMPFARALEEHNDQNVADNGLVRGDEAAAGKHLASVEVTDDNPPTYGQTPYFDALSAMTDPRFADHLMNLVNEPYSETSVIGTATNRWNYKGKDDFRTNDKFWRRMGAASDLAAEVGGPFLSPSATLALKAGKWVGDLAPEAEKVMGPAARKTSYRYRGVERRPNKHFQDDINNIRRKHDSDGRNPMPGRAAHEEMLRGVRIVERRKDGTVKEYYEPSPVIETFKDMLTDPKRYHLSRKAGTIPPSQGIIIDRKGKVVTEAVGYGEDWYLPFNLRKLGSLDGGEYIRTRAFGGPTTEDVYAGLVSGARAVTVVSHSGVFTIEFEDDFRGLRRYNDKAGRMVERYGQLLDAVKSRDVRLGTVSPARKQEISQQAAKRFPPEVNRKFYEDEYRRLEAEEFENPRLSEAEKDEVRVRLINESLREDKGLDYDAWLAQEERRAVQTGDTTTYEKIKTPEKAAVYLGLSNAAKREIDDEQARYENELNPLDLNGRGYYQALKALHDQFPYYIKDIIHTDFNTGARDFGYVKPNYIRPEGALSGYYDPTIQGIDGKTSGKISADQTMYQNVSAKNPIKYEADKTTSTKSSVPSPFPGAGGDEPDTPAPVRVDRDAKAKAAAALVMDIRGRVPDGANDPKLGFLWKGDAEEIGYRMVNEPDYAKKVDDALDFFLSPGVAEKLQPNPKLVQSYRGDAIQKRPTNAYALFDSFPMIKNGMVFDYPDVPPGQDREFYDSVIDKMIKESKIDLNVDDRDSDIVERVMDRAEELRRELSLFDDVKAGKSVARGPKMSDTDIAMEGWQLARLAQAAKLRERTGGAPAPKWEPSPKVEAPMQGAPEDVPTPPAAPQPPKPPKRPINEAKIAEYQKRMHEMVGMDKVASRIDGLIDEAYVDQQRVDEGLKPSNRTQHLVFVGNPGTGKTTIAKALAPIYKELGIIDNPVVVERKRQDLADKYVGEAEKNVQRAFDEARGGILFIDEAYALKNDPRDHVGQTIINALNDLSEERRGDTVVILAGYPDEMKKFLSHNKGLASRFPTVIHFPDYTPDQMRQIADKMIEEGDFTATDRGVKSVIKRAVNQIASEPGHGNARDVRNLFDNIAAQQKRRLRREGIPYPSRSDLMRIKSADVKAAMEELGKPMPSPRKKAA